MPLWSHSVMSVLEIHPISSSNPCKSQHLRAVELPLRQNYAHLGIGQVKGEGMHVHRSISLSSSAAAVWSSCRVPHCSSARTRELQWLCHPPKRVIVHSNGALLAVASGRSKATVWQCVKGEQGPCSSKRRGRERLFFKCLWCYFARRAWRWKYGGTVAN